MLADKRLQRRQRVGGLDKQPESRAPSAGLGLVCSRLKVGRKQVFRVGISDSGPHLG